MADRHFPNVMPDFVPETSAGHEQGADRTSLMGLLSMDYNSLAALLERQGLDIKETVYLFSPLVLGAGLVCMMTCC